MLNGATLEIDGTVPSKVIEISAGANPGDVIVNFAPGVANDATFTGVDAIEITSLGGDDTITVNANVVDTLGAVIGVAIDAGEGDDTIKDKDGTNSVTVGDGQNNIKTGKGDDAIAAGDGNNVIRGGKEDDTINGGTGEDTIISNAGDTVTP